MTYVFDIDGTICTLTDGDYSKAEPKRARIEKINQLHDEGHTIVYQTARGMGRSKGSISYSHTAFYRFTMEQLQSWGCKFDGLYLGKPSGDIYIDDKGMNDANFFTDEDR
tara:strand:- start:466 stop:795 length:330 start_codon:yes stop_codon:yes gene_type:complete